MTALDAPLRTGPTRVATPRRYLMCPPTFFAVTYAINPWMDPSVPVDVELALAQWQQLRATYERLGHDVRLIDPDPRLPDMVFAANGGLVVGGRALTSRFACPERRGEGPAYRRWFEAAADEGLLTSVHEPAGVVEGEGDLLVAGDRVLAGWGFRTDRRVHAEVQAVVGLPVVSLRLVDPRFYHLDTALAVLDDDTVAWYPAAFDPDSRGAVERLFPDAIVATEADAVVFGLNAVSDGRHVVLPVGADHLAAALADAGFEPVPVDVTEMRRAGGGPKCCTLELRP